MDTEHKRRIIGYFVEEAKEDLYTIEQGLLNLQDTMQKQEILQALPRAASSLKRGAAMLGFNSIKKTVHRLEKCFKLLREYPLNVDQNLQELLLQVFEIIAELIDQLQTPVGLTDEIATDILSNVEPVFAELTKYLGAESGNKVIDSLSGNQPQTMTNINNPTKLISSIREIQPPAPATQKFTLEASVSVVTLLEDRAQVRRIGKANLSQGLWRIVVDKVAPVLSDKSLRAEFCEDYPGARIDDVRVRRQRLLKEDDRPDEIKAVEQELRSLLQTFNNITEDRQHQEHCFNQINTILAKGLQELPIDAVWGQIDPKSWREQLQTLFKQLRDFRAEMLTSYYTQEQLSQQINDLNKKLEALSRPDMVDTARIEADLMIPQAGEYQIAFDYVVPNAMWRPWHQARLLVQEQKPTLSFRVDGCVWQRTGEDWNNVDLVFSTARASLGTEPPLLQDDFLNVQEKSQEIIVESRDRQIQTTGLGTSETPATVNLPGVDDGGEVRNLRPAIKATIPSDGRPYRVPIFSFDTEAKVEYILMPEISCQVVLKSEQTNTSQSPILAGPVDLVRTSGFVGRTSVKFLAPGEKFALGWGPDGAMRVQRTTTEETEQDHLTKWNILTTTTKLFLSNIGAESRAIKTTERVPVSELEQVKVEVIADKTTDSVQPDENGFCAWNFILEPYSQLQASLVYKISAAPEVQMDLS
ncbi:MAG TPA: mucoidy inhibitor MuiA family protein [Candidatus Obscuribacterales bacterium]